MRRDMSGAMSHKRLVRALLPTTPVCDTPRPHKASRCATGASVGNGAYDRGAGLTPSRLAGKFVLHREATFGVKESHETPTRTRHAADTAPTRPRVQPPDSTHRVLLADFNARSVADRVPPGPITVCCAHGLSNANATIVGYSRPSYGVSAVTRTRSGAVGGTPESARSGTRPTSPGRSCFGTGAACVNSI
jgi:hypothetical protein